MPVDFTITGRLVQGDAHKQQPPSKDKKTGAIKMQADGVTPVQPFFMAVAVPKNPAQRLVINGLPTWETTKAELDAEAKQAWPQFFGAPNPQLRIGAELPAGCTNPAFANKIIDGDGFDDKGQPYSRFEGYAGCWVVKMQTGFAPKVWEWSAQTGGWVEMGGPTGRFVKCGDYVSVRGNSTTNKSTDSPGMYMNIGAVTFEQEGPAIVSAAAIDPNAAFGSRGPGGAGPTPAPAASQGAHAASGTAGSTTAAPGDAPAPYDGYMATGGAPEAPGAPPAEPIMLPAANGVSYAAYKAKGWTDDQLRQHGFIA